MGGSRVFIGRLPRGCRERDVEDFFRRCGRIRQVILKRGYAFVDFRDDRDAADAVYDMNGKSMRGERMTVEIASGRPRGRGREQSRNFSGGNDQPSRSDYQITIDNLSSKISWKDLKDILRKDDIEVVYVDAHKQHRNQGIVEFKSRKDLKRAVRKLEDKEIQGRRIEISITKEGSRERSRSPKRKRSPAADRTSSVSPPPLKKSLRDNAADHSDSSDSRPPSRSRKAESPPPKRLSRSRSRSPREAKSSGSSSTSSSPRRSP